MPFISKTRDLPGSPLTGATIRLAKREAFDRRTAVAPPSAVGGAPAQKAETIPAPPMPALPKTPADAYLAQRRIGRIETPILPFLLKGRRSIEEYNQLTPGFAEELAADFQMGGVSTEPMDAMELAQRTVAALHRWTEPTATSTDLPAELYQSRNAREVKRILDTIRARRAAR